MLTLPLELTSVIVSFAPLFSKAVWEHAQVLLVGAILAPGKRTVTSVLRVMGKSDDEHFQSYHRVLNRAVWSSLAASRRLLGLLVSVFVPEGPLLFGIDDTIERRRGEKITTRGIYRDPVRSSHSHFVKASGLRWLSMMLLVRVPWAERVWALPCLTCLCPSERYYKERGRAPQKLTERAWQMIRLVGRWLPERELVFVADSSFAVISLLRKISDMKQASLITRLRLDAALYDRAPQRRPKQLGRPRLKGARRPTLQQVLKDSQTKWTHLKVAGWYGEAERVIEICSETAVWYHTGLPPVAIKWVLIRDPLEKFNPQALLCTDLSSTPQQILERFVQRWQMEVTFEEARAHLGVETQRQWSDKAVARTTPALFALYSVVTLMAERLIRTQVCPVRTAAWYKKEVATFSDTIAMVRRHLWSSYHFSMSGSKPDVIKVPRTLLERLTDTLCYPA